MLTTHQLRNKKDRNHNNSWELSIKLRKKWFYINIGTNQIVSVENEWIS